MLTNLTPSPLTSAQREALQTTLQPLLYGLVALSSHCRQSVAVVRGGPFLPVFQPIDSLGRETAVLADDLANHMSALGLPLDVTVEGAADNNPFNGTFSSGQGDPAILGDEVLSRCRQVAAMVRAALLAASAQDAVETTAELHPIALGVSRRGGLLAQALR